jgi:hypothetical protein
MEVGQYLEGKLTAPLKGGTERAGVFATAVEDAPGTLKRATTNEARFKALTDVLTPDQMAVITAIRDDLPALKPPKRKPRRAQQPRRALLSWRRRLEICLHC